MSDATNAVDAAIRAHKLAPAQREWAETYAARDPHGFQELLRHAPDYFADRIAALTEVFLDRVRIDARRRDGRETGPAIASLILRMRKLARQLSEDIDRGIVPPSLAADRDDLLREATRLSAPLSKVRVDPLSSGKGGRRRITPQVARERLLDRYGAWRETHDDVRERLTQKALAQVLPRCGVDAIADDLSRAGWGLDDVAVEWHRRTRSRPEKTG